MGVLDEIVKVEEVCLIIGMSAAGVLAVDFRVVANGVREELVVDELPMMFGLEMREVGTGSRTRL